MKSFTTWIFFLLLLSLSGCGSLGQLEISRGQVSVFTGDEILTDARKKEALQEGHGVEYLHDYVEHYLRRNRIRQSLQLEITIVRLRISWGRDHMATETVVLENGQEIDRFTNVSTTGRSSDIVERFAKDLAKKIVTQVKSY